MAAKAGLNPMFLLLGSLILTADPLLITEVDSLKDYQVIFYRYICQATIILLFLLASENVNFFNKFGSITPVGVVAAVFLGVFNFSFTLAVQYTLVSYVLAIIASSSAFSSLVSMIFFREGVNVKTIITILIVFACLAMIFLNQSEKSNDVDSFWGLILAVVAAISLGIFLVCIQHVGLNASPDVNAKMLPYIVIAGYLTAIVALVLGADVTDLVFNPAEEMSTAYLLIQGAVVLPLGFGLLSSAAVRASMSEVNTSLLCVPVLGFLWIFLAHFEQHPYNDTLYYGSVICFVVYVHSLLSFDQALELESSKKGYDKAPELSQSYGDIEAGHLSRSQVPEFSTQNASDSNALPDIRRTYASTSALTRLTGIVEAERQAERETSRIQASAAPAVVAPHLKSVATPQAAVFHKRMFCEVPGCRVAFAMARQRHHCRNCGLSICEAHSQHYANCPAFSGESAKRVCDACYTTLTADASITSSSTKI